MESIARLDSFAAMTLADIVRLLPSARTIFRTHQIDFCCKGNRTLLEVASLSNLPLAQIETELSAAEESDVGLKRPRTRDLIEHIVERYHEVHRRELPLLIGLSEKVEGLHRGHPQLPSNLPRLLQTMRLELEMHMCKEEHIVFALIMEGEGPLIGSAIDMMMTDHDDHGVMLRELEALTSECRPPADACGDWRELYAGLRKLVDDLVDHIHLENNVLFPRFMGKSHTE